MAIFNTASVPSAATASATKPPLPPLIGGPTWIRHSRSSSATTSASSASQASPRGPEGERLAAHGLRDVDRRRAHFFILVPARGACPGANGAPGRDLADREHHGRLRTRVGRTRRRRRARSSRGRRRPTGAREYPRICSTTASFISRSNACRSVGVSARGPRDNGVGEQPLDRRGHLGDVHRAVDREASAHRGRRASRSITSRRSR